MKKSRLLILIFLIPMFLVCSSAFAGGNFKFKPKKPFAGKFEASIEYQQVPIIIVYILKMEGNNISGWKWGRSNSNILQKKTWFKYNSLCKGTRQKESRVVI